MKSDAQTSPTGPLFRISRYRRITAALGHAPRVVWSLTKAMVTESTMYRADYLISFALAFLPTLMVTFVWWSIHAARGDAERLALLAYFLAVMLVEQVAAPEEFQWRLSRRIQGGMVELEALLVAPLGVVWLGTAVGMRAGQIIAKSPGLVLLIVGMLLAGSWVGVGHLLYAIVALCGAFLVRFLLGVAVAALSFWIDDTAGVYFTMLLVASVLSGRLIPLDLLGPRLEALLALTPFYYTTFAPAKLLAGGSPEYPVLVGQVVWGVLLLAAAWVLTRAGLRRYANVAA